MIKRIVHPIYLFVCGILMVFALIMVNINYKLDYEKQNLNRDLKTILEQNEQLKIQIAMEADLPFIYEYATSQLNMVFPERIVYIHE